MSQATMTTDQYLKNQWDFHVKFVKALLKQLDASPSYNTMEYKLLGARLMYATLELQISDTLLEWIDGLMDRLRESMDAFKALAKMPHKQNIDPIVAKIGQSQKCLQDFETLAKWHSVDYMSLWTHKKQILAELEERRRDPETKRKMEDLYKGLKDLDQKSSSTKSPALLVQKFLLGQTQQPQMEPMQTMSCDASWSHCEGSTQGHWS